MKTILSFILIFFSIQTLVSQETDKTICDNMGIVRQYFHSGLTIDSLQTLKLRMLEKGVVVTYENISFDESGHLSDGRIFVKCKGCQLGGGFFPGKKYFKSRVQKGGFYYNHGGSTTFQSGLYLPK